MRQHKLTRSVSHCALTSHSLNKCLHDDNSNEDDVDDNDNDKNMVYIYIHI